MGRKVERLTALGVVRLKKPGYHPDGGGLYLQVSAGGSKSWIFRFAIGGRERHMGLGSLNAFSLAEARARATAARRLLADGIDPLEHRQASRAEQQASKSITFDEAAKRYIASHKSGWRNAKHASQWQSTLDTYASPVFGTMACRDIETEHIMRAVEPIWMTKAETASRVRARIELVLDWAATSGYREGVNPARWKGRLDKLLPSPAKVVKRQHHPAVALTEMAAVFKQISETGGMGAKALMFTILTAARSGEVRGATWDEIDLAARVWTVPGDRMKAGREHRVPLSEHAVALLASLPRRSDKKAKTPEYVFPAPRGGVLSDMTLTSVMRRLGREEVPHGFRSTFRDWAGECTSYPRDVCEMALAHTVANAVEAAYRRGDMLERRRPMMEDWAAFCLKEEASS